MAKNIDFLGATFPDVPSIRLPQHEGGLVSFDDTSDATATAEDIARNKTAYVNGQKVTGTASGGSANIEALSVTQNGTYTASGGVDGYSPVTVNVSGGGSVSVPPKQINFIDYDGTILYSYTSAEWANVSALPDNPTHSGLVSQGWNWTKAQIDAQLTAMPGAPVWVGQMYVTQSGDTEIDVTFVDSARLSPYLTIAPNGTVEIDWGDGSAHDTVTGTSGTTRKSTQHTYADIGDYTIKLHVVSGTCAFYGSSSDLLLSKNATASNQNYIYSNRIKAVRIGQSVSINSNALMNCQSLESITIPSGIGIGNYAFQKCYKLKSLTIPSGVTTINQYICSDCHSLASISVPGGNASSVATYAFYNCYGLSSVTIKSTVKSISTYTFGNCHSLASITIPSSVTSIGNNAFNGCYGMAEYHFKPTTPPSISSNTFANIPSDCIIYVPAESLEAYQTATNWTSQASKMQGE